MSCIVRLSPCGLCIYGVNVSLYIFNINISISFMKWSVLILIKTTNKESVIRLHKEIDAHQNKCMLSSLNCMSKAAR